MKTEKKDTLFKIIAILIAISAVCGVIYFNKDFFSINKLKCEMRGDYFMNSKCFVSNANSLKKKIAKIKITIPTEDGKTVVGQEGISDNGFDSAKKLGLVFLMDKISLIDDVKLFVVPFSTEENGHTKYYLGLFSTARSTTDYFNGVHHLDSYFIGQDVILGKTITRNGLYNDFVVQECSENGVNKELKLRVGGYPEKIYQDNDCNEIGQIVEKSNGNGGKYEICLFSNGNQCEIKQYKNGACPPEGYNLSTFSEEAAYCLLTGHYPKEKEGVCQILEKDLSCSLSDYYNEKCGLE